MKRLTIYQRYFTNSDCFNAAKTTAVWGVQVHSTGANNPQLRRYVQPDDGLLGVNTNGNSHNRPGGDVCASAYIGKLADGTVAVYQALPWRYRCWLSGKGNNGNANKLGYIGFEICEDGLTDRAYFDAAMEQAVLLTAHLCIRFGVNPDAPVSHGALAVSDHAELHRAGLASDHGDITAWLRRFGRDMDWFRAVVKDAIKDGVQAEYINCDEEKKMENRIFSVRYDQFSGNPDTTYLNLRAGPGTNYKALIRVPAYAEIEVLDNSISGWYNARFGGMTGYVMAQYCTVIPETAQDEDYGGASGLVTDENAEPEADELARLHEENERLRQQLSAARGALADLLDDMERMKYALK